MTISAVQTLITDAITAFGGVALVVLTAILGLAVAFMVYSWGKRKLAGTLR